LFCDFPKTNCLFFENNRQYFKSLQKKVKCGFLGWGMRIRLCFGGFGKTQKNCRRILNPIKKNFKTKPNAYPLSKTAFELLLKGLRILTIVL
jgi:hypothetical protein